MLKIILIFGLLFVIHKNALSHCEIDEDGELVSAGFNVHSNSRWNVDELESSISNCLGIDIGCRAPYYKIYTNASQSNVIPLVIIDGFDINFDEPEVDKSLEMSKVWRCSLVKWMNIYAPQRMFQMGY